MRKTNTKNGESKNKKLRVCNLYCGIGGNRKLWEDVEVTAVEWDEEIAQAYRDHFPYDKVIIGDAHKYLLEHYSEFDFIWSSPPCQTHSRARFWGWQKKKPAYPDMKLYQEILLLDHSFSGKWVVENTVPYYKPLIPPTQRIGRHLFWSNFMLGHIEPNDGDIHQGTNKNFEDVLGFDLSSYKPKNKQGGERRKLDWLRNCVSPETGKYILDRARDIVTKSNTEQTTLFE